MELNLPELIDLNTYIHTFNNNRFGANEIKQTMTFLVAAKCKEQKITKLDKIRKFTCIWRHKDKRKDFDNVEFGVKWIKDGLVKAGVVANDGWKHFPPRTLHKHEVCPDNPGVTVIIK